MSYFLESTIQFLDILLMYADQPQRKRHMIPA